MRERDPLGALSLVLRSVEAPRNTRALALLLGSFALAGLLVAMAETSFARAADPWGPLQTAAAVLASFYGGNAAGILVMDEARGLEVRSVSAALRAALRTAHRLPLAIAWVLGGCAGVAAVLAALLWLSRVGVSGPVLGPLLFGLAVPVSVITIGGLALALVTVVVPLAAPAVWAGSRVPEIVRGLTMIVRERLFTVALLMTVVSLLSAGMGALATAIVIVGGRTVAALGVLIVGVDVPARQLMAGLFGHGLRSFGAGGMPVVATGHAAAALVGGGVVFALALLLPSLVYLRGTCAVYLAMQGETVRPG